MPRPRNRSSSKKTLQAENGQVRHTDWADINAANRAWVSAMYGGVDQDVCQVFFNLSPDILERVLVEYRKRYGKAAYTYAKAVYAEWQYGRVQMSGQVCERLLEIVPRYLDFKVKYDLLNKLWRSREGSRLRVEIPGGLAESAALDTAISAINKARSTKLPDYIAKRLNWLADNDGEVAKLLLKEVMDREHELIVAGVRDAIRRLFATRIQLDGRSVEMQYQHEIALPGLKVLIVLNVSNKTSSEGRRTVPDQKLDQGGPTKKPSDGNLVPVTNPPQGGQLAPIQNPQNLLDEALRRMGPEKQAEVLGKAADEALRLQVKGKEHEMDQEIVGDKIDLAGRVARDITHNPMAKMEFETEHRSKQGDTRIKVSNKPDKSPLGCLSVMVVGIAFLILLAWSI